MDNRSEIGGIDTQLQTVEDTESKCSVSFSINLSMVKSNYTFAEIGVMKCPFLQK